MRTSFCNKCRCDSMWTPLIVARDYIVYACLMGHTHKEWK